MKKILLLVLTVVPVLGMCASAAVPIERNESDEIPYALAQNVFAENEELLCTICETMLERQADKLDIRYVEGEDNVYDRQVWEERGDEYVQTSIPEYTAILELEYDRSLFNWLDGIVLPVFDFVKQEDAIDISFRTYSNYEEPLRNNRHGFYYVDCDCCENASLEDMLAKHMSDEWEFKMKKEDEYELAPMSEHFIYYHWRG